MSERNPLDARGVEISPGDTVIYGFGVGRSVAMAEGIVLGEGEAVALTPSGRVKVKVARRSYSSGEKPVVNVQADRLVALKSPSWGPLDHTRAYLPPSPLPTQDELFRSKAKAMIQSYEDDLERTEPPAFWSRAGYNLEHYHAYVGRRLAQWREKLEALDG